MLRFKRYAHCVRKVTNSSRRPGRRIQWLGLENLVQPTVSITPNIHTISWVWRAHERDVSSHCLILLLLIGPSTTSLGCFGANSRSGLAVELATLLLERALDVQSPLTDLTLYTKVPTDDAAVAHLPSLLPRFDRLTRLRISTSLVHGRLLDCIRCLPGLCTLSFVNPMQDGVSNPHGGWHDLDTDSDWEGEVFPSLRSLAVRYITFHGLGDLFAFYPSLLRHVTMLDLQMSEDSFGNIQVDSITHIFDLLSNSSLQLSHLAIAFPSSVHPYMVPISSLDHLLVPNLEHLTMHSIHLIGDSCWCTDLGNRWPRLSHLIIPHQPAWPLDLLKLAGHGSLRVLCVDLRAPQESASVTIGNSISGSAATGVRLESQFELSDVPEEILREFAG
ncbi:hypothetical protein FS749_003961 [Ceratobasidium sp. UAMH 11750]|nr:hypothetical protein FS749_003961 [Ceratobasidium sp. UAMH 11750]